MRHQCTILPINLYAVTKGLHIEAGLVVLRAFSRENQRLVRCRMPLRWDRRRSIALEPPLEVNDFQYIVLARKPHEDHDTDGTSMYRA